MEYFPHILNRLGDSWHIILRLGGINITPMKCSLPKFLIAILFSFYSNAGAQSITELGFFSPLISSFDMKFSGQHLVITQQGLKIFDVSNPASPVQTGSAAYPGSYAYEITVNGNYAYLAEGANGAFSIYDVSNINFPALTGTIYLPSTSFVTGGD